MVVLSAFFARSAQSAQNVAADCGVTNAIGVRCFRLTHVTPKSVFAMPRAGKVRDVICASAPHHGHGQRDTPSGVGMVSGGFLLIVITYPSPKFLDRFGTVLEVVRESISAPFPA